MVEPKSGMIGKSYQNAPGTMEGWNDCPISPKAISRSVSQRSRRRNRGYVSFLNGSAVQSSTSSLQSGSSSSLNLPPPRRISPDPARMTPSTSVSTSGSEDSVSTEEVDAALKELLAKPSTLPEQQYGFYSAKLSAKTVLATEANRKFIATVIKDFYNGRELAALKREIVDFMQSNIDVSWCISLRKILEGAKRD